MKKAYTIRIILLILIIMLPLSRLHTKVGSVSEIDNKYLTDFPDIDQGFSSFVQQLNDYFSDRIGGRERLLQLNSSMNDKLFGYLDHASYEYGQDGYVFLKLNRYQKDFEFLDQFTDFLLAIQEYCEARDVPFVYQLNPSKASVYTQYLPESFNYQNDRLAYLQKQLHEKGINYVDATPLLIELSKNEQVFNRQFDAGHWNDLGAFHSVNQLLEKMAEYRPEIQTLKFSDFEVTQELQNYHANSKVKINEYVPRITPIQRSWEYVDMEIRNEIEQSPSFPAFFRTTNTIDNGINLLMFHGSGYNGKGHPFVAQALESYQGIHNYQNIIDFDYYFNIFQPNFVVVNSAEQVTTSSYFSVNRMNEKRFNPALNPADFELSDKKVTPVEVSQGAYITTVWFDSLDIDYGYYVNDNFIYDLIPDESGSWSFSGFNSNIDLSIGELYLVNTSGEKINAIVGNE